jgi:uncharacterized membrane protein YeaQ/YmgE (transglycosylase-associated protein family)
MTKNRFISFRSQILNRNRSEGLIGIYCFGLVGSCIKEFLSRLISHSVLREDFISRLSVTLLVIEPCNQ